MNLVKAAGRGEAGEVRRLINGVDLECKDRAGYTPLMWAARNGHTECAKILLDAGAKIDATSNVRRRALSPRFRPRESAPAVPLARARGESAALSRARLRCARAVRPNPADRGSTQRSCRYGPRPPRPQSRPHHRH